MTRLLVEISGDSSKLISELKKGGASVKEFAGETEKGKGGLKGLADELGLIPSPAALATAGVAALGAGIVMSVNAAREGRAVQAQLAAVLESTGHAARISQDELNKHAEAIQSVTNFDDEAVGSAQALLLTFTKIGREVFPEATKTTLDMATAFKMDASGAAIMLGKALNDPKEGISALTRVGVSFTEQQKEQIKSMAEMGDIAGAQALILEEVNKQVAGSAEAAREADGGFIAAGNSLANLSEAFGETIMVVSETTGAMDGLISLLGMMTETAGNTAAAFEEGVGRGLLTIFDNANPVTQLLEKMGVDVIPNVVTATDEMTDSSLAAAESLGKQGEAHALTVEQIQAQEEAAANLAKTQMEALVDLGKREEEYTEKKNELLEDRLKVESEASEASVKNNQDLNKKIQENEADRAKKIEELHQKAAESEGKLTGDKFNAEMQKINDHHNEKAQEIRDSYTEENEEIRTKLDERQQAIDEQLAKEEEAYKQKAQDLKLLMAAQALEQSGQLQEMTGIAGITAQQYVDAVKYGAIEANKEVETEMAKIVKGFEGSQKDQKSLAESNAESLKRILGEAPVETAKSWNKATNSIVSDFERQAQAAYKAAQASSKTVNYSGGYKGPGFAAGADFVVPPGYPNDSFPFRAQTGERVIVQPANQTTFHYSPTYNGVTSSNPERDYHLMRSLA